MQTVAAPVQTFDMREPIPGYTLQERIGAGGYGEVWRADAPGGLTKAVKIVFGSAQAARADRELKSLERIKAVRHPMLLSLERIEIVDEHLVIVTELADGSLRDRFEEYVESGLAGIPRDELLTYMRDASDALDYLYDNHSLQHLDVKPENLLLVANHVKVADFGLVRSLEEHGESLVGGLTPLYAAPEVFDGRPNRHSDQYSLAVMFQELLTGEPPFGGRTPAQLAAQHLHSPPCLTPLPKADQHVIARALAKNPAKRFSSCRELIDSLQDEARVASRPRRSTADRRTTNEAAVYETSSKGLAYPASRTVTDLPPISGDLSSSIHPTVFVGIGGAAAMLLRQLRKRMLRLFPDLESIPSLQMLLLDTDATSLMQATGGDRSSALRERDTRHIPLRQSTEYRNRSKTLLEWLSRRWLYNIPRSLQTEGIRPLGRLALVDHHETVEDSLRYKITGAVSSDSLQVSTQQSGREFAAGPRVVVVASSAGGTGGGMALDVGYLTRDVLEREGIEAARVTGLLLHSSPARAQARDLAVANTLSLLNELNCYSSPVGYPGEPACDLSARHEAPFDETYFLHLGDMMSDDMFEEQLVGVAEYLYHSTVGGLGPCLDVARSTDEDSVLRTFGLSQLTGSSRADVSAEAGALGCSIVDHWMSDESTAAAPDALRQVTAVAEKVAAGLELRLDQLLKRADQLIEREIKVSPTQYFRRLIRDAQANNTSSEPAEFSRQVRERIDAIILSTGTGFNSTPDHSIQTGLEDRLREVCVRQRQALDDWFTALVDTPNARIVAAAHAADWFSRCLDTIRRQTRSGLQQLERDLAEASPSPDATAVLVYAMVRLREAAHRGILGFLGDLQKHVDQTREQLNQLTRRLQQFKESTFSRSEQRDGRLSAELTPRLRDFDASLVATLRQERCSLGELLSSGQLPSSKLESTLRVAAESLVSRGATVDALEVDSTHLERATPWLLRYGGQRRWLLSLPESSDADGWQQAISAGSPQPPTVVRSKDGSAALCCEVQKVPLENIVVALAGNRHDYFPLAARLHTRVDVEWPSLVPPQSS